MERQYICIDLKSFFASVECIERGLDPFTTNLVVADPSREAGTICLAITPAMKALGIKNRCRVFEIPKDVSYIMAPPRMKLYMQKSAEIVSIYKRFVSPDDMHIYSIDECFIDVTNYLKLYRTDTKSMAQKLMDAVFRQTGICATAGIGTNLFLAKVALDIVAKHAPDHIGVLDEATFRETIWYHRPITDIWNVGPGTAKRLEKYGIFDLHGVTLLPKETLYREFGVTAEYLIDHANGRESCTIQEIHNYKPKSHSISHGQVLFRAYSVEEAELILKEMVYGTVLELIEKHLITEHVSLYIGYQDTDVPPTNVSRKLSAPTDSLTELLEIYLPLYRENVKHFSPIRRIGLAFGSLLDASMAPILMFSDVEAEAKEHRLMETLVDIKKNYGSNAVLKGINYLPAATMRERNGLIGGHRA